jgi:hypothetical protein
LIRGQDATAGKGVDKNEKKLMYRGMNSFEGQKQNTRRC